jgi:hypothetical protein
MIEDSAIIHKLENRSSITNNSIWLVNHFESTKNPRPESHAENAPQIEAQG